MNHCVLLRAEASVIAGVGRCSGHFHLQAVGEHAPSSQEVLRKPLAVGDFSLAVGMLTEDRRPCLLGQGSEDCLPWPLVPPGPWRPGAVPPKCADALLLQGADQEMEAFPLHVRRYAVVHLVALRAPRQYLQLIS